MDSLTTLSKALDRSLFIEKVEPPKALSNHSDKGGNFDTKKNSNNKKKRKAKDTNCKDKRRLCEHSVKYDIGTCYKILSCHRCQEKGHINKFCS